VDELKSICSSKGGTSVPRIFLGITVEIKQEYPCTLTSSTKVPETSVTLITKLLV